MIIAGEMIKKSPAFLLGLFLYSDLFRAILHFYKSASGHHKTY